MPGPAPKHPSVRQRRNKPKADFRSLPATGYTGETPPWPLAGDVRLKAQHEHGVDQVAKLQVAIEEATDGRTRGRLRRELAKAEINVAVDGLRLKQTADAERAMWAELWQSPQAAIWAESAATRHDLALYVRWSIRAEQGDMKAAAEARQLSDRHGINPLALLRLRAEVEHTEEIVERGNRRRSTARAKGGKPPEDPRQGLRVVS